MSCFHRSAAVASALSSTVQHELIQATVIKFQGTWDRIAGPSRTRQQPFVRGFSTAASALHEPKMAEPEAE
jgi:hypothetical protein